MELASAGPGWYMREAAARGREPGNSRSMAQKKGLFGRWASQRVQPEVSVGQRYQKRDAAWVVWEVSMLTTGTDGVAYAQLVRVDDRTMRKTVSRSTIERGIEYVRVRDF